MRSLVAGLAAVLVLVAAVNLAAKGATVRIAISGVHLQRPIDVTNPDALVNIWTGTRTARWFFDFPKSFLQGIAPAPEATLPRYTLTFYVRSGGTETPSYVVQYAPDPKAGGGYVYLPTGDRPIVRPGDGQWNRASSEWSAAINAALAAQ